MWHRRAFGALILAATATAMTPAWAQTVEEIPGLTQQERQQYQARMHNAQSEAERNQIQAEYRHRVQTRQKQQGSGAGQGGSQSGGGAGGGQGGGGGGQGGGSGGNSDLLPPRSGKGRG